MEKKWEQQIFVEWSLSGESSQQITILSPWALYKPEVPESRPDNSHPNPQVPFWHSAYCFSFEWLCFMMDICLQWSGLSAMFYILELVVDEEASFANTKPEMSKLPFQFLRDISLFVMFMICEEHVHYKCICCTSINSWHIASLLILFYFILISNVVFVF